MRRFVTAAVVVVGLVVGVGLGVAIGASTSVLWWMALGVAAGLVAIGVIITTMYVFNILAALTADVRYADREDTPPPPSAPPPSQDFGVEIREGGRWK